MTELAHKRNTMSEENEECNFKGLPIQNPHLGKPAYVVASYPCEKEVAPCELQEPPEDED